MTTRPAPTSDECGGAECSITPRPPWERRWARTSLVVTALIALAVPARARGQATSAGLTNADILGFEERGTWHVAGAVARPTSQRSEGQHALGLRPLASQVVLTSALLGRIEALSSRMAFDLFIPAGAGESLRGGSAALFIDAPSVGIKHEDADVQSLRGQPVGSFQRVTFSIPAEFVQLLGTQTARDLRLTIALELPHGVSGIVIIDNLRPVTQPSLDFQARRTYAPDGTSPAVMRFPQAVIQIPASFRVTSGNAGNGALSLQYRDEEGETVTCRYRGEASRLHPVDPADVANGLHYRFVQCSDGGVAGDLVGTTQVRISVVSGDPQAGPTVVSGQLALNPNGDARGHMTPIPTYLGADIQEFGQILDQYVAAALAGTPSQSEDVQLPVPPWATYSSWGDSIEEELPAAAPGVQATASFQRGHAADPNATWDSFWNITGNQESGVRNLNIQYSDLDAEFTAGAVLFKRSIQAVRAEAHFRSERKLVPPGTPTVPVPFVDASYGVYLFGNRVAGERFQMLTFSWSPGPLQPPPPRYPIWSLGFVSVGATLASEFSLSVTGNVQLDSVTTSFVPSWRGYVGLDLTFKLGVSGSVEGQLDLLRIRMPLTAGIVWRNDTTPGLCASFMDTSLTLEPSIRTLSGRLVLKYRLPFKIPFVPQKGSTTLASYPGVPLYEQRWPLVDLKNERFPLDPALCGAPPSGWAPGSLLVAHLQVDGSTEIAQLAADGSPMREFGARPGGEFWQHLALAGDHLFRNNAIAGTIDEFAEDGSLVRTFRPTSSPTLGVQTIGPDFAGTSLFLSYAVEGTNVLHHLDLATLAAPQFLQLERPGGAQIQEMAIDRGRSALYVLALTDPSVDTSAVARVRPDGTFDYFESPELEIPYAVQAGGIAADPASGNVYVTTNSKVVTLDQNGALVGTFPLVDGAPVIDVATNGELVVGLSAAGALSVYSPAGELRRTIAVPGATSVLDVLVVR